MAALKKETIEVFDYVKKMTASGDNITANDIADALDRDVRSVNGTVTSFQKKGLMKRTPAEVELPDGTHKATKLISLTEAGQSFDPRATE